MRAWREGPFTPTLGIRRLDHAGYEGRVWGRGAFCEWKDQK